MMYLIHGNERRVRGSAFVSEQKRMIWHLDMERRNHVSAPIMDDWYLDKSAEIAFLRSSKIEDLMLDSKRRNRVSRQKTIRKLETRAEMRL